MCCKHTLKARIIIEVKIDPVIKSQVKQKAFIWYPKIVDWTPNMKGLSMPAAIHKRSIDESIAVQIKVLDLYIWN